jgi:CHAD domain-containing protein
MSISGRCWTSKNFGCHQVAALPLRKSNAGLEVRRYSCEFFNAISRRPKRYERYLNGVTAVQEQLGDLNDTAKTRTLVQDFVKSDPGVSTGVAFSAGAVVAAGTKDADTQIAVAQDALEKFVSAKPFW